jgi:uncharacterized protein Smg (DUF494 family)
MRLPGDPPLLVLGWGDVQALDHVLRGYLAYLRKQGGDCTQTRVLEGLRERISVLLVAGEESESILLFTLPELLTLKAAVQGFRQLITHKVPASPERDGVLKSLLSLQQELTGMLSPYVN